MGPPIFIGGNHTLSGRGVIGVQSFNGAADFHRRKSYPKWSGRYWGTELQWGRRFSSAEIPPSLRRPLPALAASMGPPIFIGGNDRLHALSEMAQAASMGPPIFIGGNRLPQTEGF